MTHPEPETITFAETMTPAERRIAALGLLQETGRLRYWGAKNGCYRVERTGAKLKAMTDKQVDWLIFVELARALGYTA